MAISVARREAAGGGGPAIGCGPVLAAGLTVPDVPGWAVRRPQITGLVAQGFRHLRAGPVSRAGLIGAARLSGCRLVAVTAPAGYGKSMFLAEWAAVEDRRELQTACCRSPPVGQRWPPFGALRSAIADDLLVARHR